MSFPVYLGIDFGSSGARACVIAQVPAGLRKRDELATLSLAIDPGRASGLDHYPLPRPGERYARPAAGGAVERAGEQEACHGSARLACHGTALFPGGAGADDEERTLVTMGSNSG